MGPIKIDLSFLAIDFEHLQKSNQSKFTKQEIK